MQIHEFILDKIWRVSNKAELSTTSKIARVLPALIFATILRITMAVEEICWKLLMSILHMKKESNQALLQILTLKLILWTFNKCFN